MKVFPISKDFQNLNDWQIGLIYEVAMNYPEDGLRKCYFDAKRSACNFEDGDLLDLGYSREEIAAIKRTA